jgi:hypothetical protein
MPYESLFLDITRHIWHIQDMESDLRDAIARLMVKIGRVEALDLLAEKTGKTRKTITRWLENGVPDGHSAYLVALACGKKEEEAMRIGRKHPSVKAMRAAG